MNRSPVFPLSTATAFDLAVQMATQRSKRNLMLKMEDSKVEELVLMRCWLARYWGLAAKLGVYPHISHKKHAKWASVAPIPLEVVISAGQKAKALAAERPLVISSTKLKDVATDESSEEEKMTGKGEEVSSIDSQILMAKEGLKELTALRVEEAVLLKISQNQNPTLIWLGLSREQAQDIQFKQAWLVYHWRQAQASRVVEQDVVVERLLYWINQSNRPPTYEDAVNVQRGLFELWTLGLEPRGQTSWTCMCEMPESQESKPTDFLMSIEESKQGNKAIS